MISNEGFRVFCRWVLDEWAQPAPGREDVATSDSNAWREVVADLTNKFSSNSRLSPISKEALTSFRTHSISSSIGIGCCATGAD